MGEEDSKQPEEEQREDPELLKRIAAEQAAYWEARKKLNEQAPIKQEAEQAVHEDRRRRTETQEKLAAQKESVRLAREQIKKDRAARAAKKAGRKPQPPQTR